MTLYYRGGESTAGRRCLPIRRPEKIFTTEHTERTEEKQKFRCRCARRAISTPQPIRGEHSSRLCALCVLCGEYLPGMLQGSWPQTASVAQPRPLAANWSAPVTTAAMPPLAGSQALATR